jgi:hypothetical protein
VPFEVAVQEIHKVVGSAFANLAFTGSPPGFGKSCIDMIAAKVSDGSPVEGETLLPTGILDFIMNLVKQILDPK